MNSINTYNRKSTLRVFVSTLALALITFYTTAQKKYIFEKPKMGSPFTITIYGNDSSGIALAAEQAFATADSLNKILSDYIDNSEINFLSLSSGKGNYMNVSAPLFDIIQRSIKAAQLSDGSFDITMGPVIKLWRVARRTNHFPDRDSIKLALRKTGYTYIRLDSIHQSIMLTKKGMQLDIGGIGKGYVANAALQTLFKAGFKCAMVNAGGKIVAGDSPPGYHGWIIGINMPEQKETVMPELLSLNSVAVATSGDIYQNLQFNGKKYSHIIDPKTGMGITKSRNVTAIATDAATADWLSTACSIMDIPKSMALVESIPGAALLITEIVSGKTVKHSSKRFINYLQN